MLRIRTVAVPVAQAIRRSLRARDLSLHAAAVTFYGGIAVVPVALLALWLSGLAAGRDRVARLTASPVGAWPDALGADRVAAALVEAGLQLSPLSALAALLPASLYGEGLRRAFGSLSGPGETAVGWRGRLLVLPLLAAGPALLLSLLMVLPSATRLLRAGGLAGVGGVIMSFLATWLVLSVVMVWLYRVVGRARPNWLVTAAAGSFTAANVSGFLHGFVLFCALPLDLGLPFGGFGVVGAVVAVAFWLYLFHAIVLLGYVFTLELDRFTAAQTAAATVTGDAYPSRL